MPVPSTLSGKALSTWKSAHDAALEGTCKNSGKRKGECASRVAWAAVKNSYKKEGDTWVAKESVESTERVIDIFPVQEAVFDEEKMEAKVVLIQEGMTMSRPPRNYTKSALKQAARDGTFNGVKMFVNHSNKPPIKRSLSELVSAVGATEYREDSQGRGQLVAPVKFFDEKFFKFAQHAQEHVGVSINAMVKGVRYRGLDGRAQEDVSGFAPGPNFSRSVDWVAFPSAGGGIEQFLAQEGVDMPDAIDWEQLTPEMVQENAPDLYQSIIDKAPKATTKRAQEGADDDEDEEDDDPESPSAKFLKLTQKELDSLVLTRVQEAIAESETRTSKRREAARKVSEKINGAALPPLTKARLIASFDGVEEFDDAKVQESIEAATAELKAVAGPKILGMGSSQAPEGENFVGPAQESVLGFFGMLPDEKGTPSSAGKKE